MDMDVTRVKTVYKEQEYWLGVLAVWGGTLFFTGSLGLAIGLTLGLVGCTELLRRYVLSKEYEEIDTVYIEKEDIPDQIHIGTTRGSNQVHLSLEALNNTFIIGMTRYGKTRLVLSLISEFIEKYSPEELLLAFSDAKAVSFNVFGRSRHLYAPIARSPEETGALIELLLEEMYRRLALFSDYHEKICTNLDEYMALTDDQLPRIIVIFDEVADSIDKDSLAEKNLTTLAKMGLATGINLIIITQRPTKMGISNEVTSQCQTILSTYMKNPTEYGSVAKIPQPLYTNMVPEKGLFMAFNPDLAPVFLKEYPDYQGWGFLKSRYVQNAVIEGIAITDSTTHLDLPELGDSLPAWGGSEQDKMDAVEALEMKMGRVTPDDMKKYFGVSYRTGKTWVDKYNA